MKNQHLLLGKFSQYRWFQLLFTFLLISQTYSIHSQCFDSVTFVDSGAFNFTIPTDSANYIIEIEVRGADGGDFIWGSNPSSAGGQGANMKASYLVPASSELLVLVGASGLDGNGSSAAGGGGGGSAVIINNNEVLIAASAGGGGGLLDIGQGGFANANSSAQGGTGIEGSGGGGFGESGSNGSNGTGGEAGSLGGISNGGLGSQDAGGGGMGFGGGGGGFEDSGGGGGGYKGGDGGDLYEGKGGDSFVTDLFSGSLIFGIAGEDGDGSNINGHVTISCLPVTLVELELITFSQPLCFNDLGGTFEVLASSGVAPYSYSLNGGIFGDNNIFTGLSAGDYVITVKDGLENTSTVNVTLVNPPLLVNTFLNSTDNICFGAFEGSIEIEGSGGTAPSGYSYSINGGSVQSSGLFTGLPSGFYVVSVIDNNGCETQITADIISPPDLLITATNIVGVTCLGDSDGLASAFASGGVGEYNYALDGGDFDLFDSFSSLATGLHSVAVIDENGCIETFSFTISEPDPIIILSDVIAINCAGDSTGSIIINVSGGNPGFQYSFDGQEEDTIGIYNNLIAGIYNIGATDLKGCSAFIDIEITESAPLELTTTSITSASCGENGEVIFDLLGAQGGALYSVDGIVGESNTFILPAGIYFATACDSLGCAASLQFEINQLSDLSIVIDSQIAVTCFGASDGSVDVSSAGGEGEVTYSLDGEPMVVTSLFENLGPGNYIITAFDSVGCSSNILITINGPDELKLEIENITGVACFGGDTGALSFDISGGNAPYNVITPYGTISEDSSFVSISDIIGGDMILSIVDSLGCLLKDTILIDENLPLQISIDSISSVNCAEATMGYVSLSATGGVGNYVFLQNGILSNGVFDGLMEGNYIITVEDSLGCEMSQNVDIGKVGQLILQGFGVSDVSCNGGEDGLFTLSIPNSIGDIMWTLDGISNPDSNFINLMAGQYSITALDSFGCFYDFSIEVNQPNELIGEVINFNTGNGTDGTITVVADGGTEPYLYSIDDKVTFQDSATFTNLVVGDYTITIIDINDCEVSVDQLLTDIINEVFEDLIISPNPALDKLNITRKSGSRNQIDVIIYDMNGRIIDSRPIVFDGNKATISIDEMQSGAYFIKFMYGGKFIVRRFFKI
ncbi:MAG: hypothetical protein ACI86M_001887 [Saprospiraceae bacterium]|jgi:hypothetical protein